MKWHLNHAAHGDKPWAVQVEALRRAEERPAWGNFLEQGLGKTPLTLNEFVEFAGRGEVDMALVLAPQSFKMDWKYALDEWGAPPEIGAGCWPRDPLPPEVCLYSMNYEAVRSPSGKVFLKNMIKNRKFMLVVDEATAINNPASAQTKAVIQLSKDAWITRELDGTPMVRNVTDYYAKLKVLDQIDGWNPVAFRNHFAIRGGYMGNDIVGIRNEEELAGILNRCSFRALKTDWRKDLPPQVFTPVHLEMTDVQRRHYRDMMEEFYTMVNDLHVTAEMVLTQYAKLRQISAGLAMSGGEHELLMPPSENPKLRATLDIIAGSDTKAVVVYWHKPCGEMLFNALQAAGYEPAVIGGGMKGEQVIEQKRRFNDDASCRVILTQQAAGCRGHTIIGGAGRDRCNRMIFFENSFSLMQRLQMQDRIHRGDQDLECQYYDLHTSPMDGVITNILIGRKELADSMDEIVLAVRANH